ncbi:MAG: aldehyde dehydrogenase family protein [Leptolyngbya foveolarum]|uniref:Aldehyde dehydrogenase n=1 Tax=Leptolyngbya foveolarum TaxID=47253 RepID=A0A2W4UCC4_9CYAN|nr:MAG: aldehyde dehydrogenase family protein [Leptolyngbya foveolarum]
MTSKSNRPLDVFDPQIQTQVQDSLQRQRAFFATGETRSLPFRRTQLQHLKENITAATEDIYAALAADLGKCKTEAYLSEVALALGDIDDALKHLSSWSKPQRVGIPLPFQPAKGKVVPEPLGVVLIISPWNYPFHLAIGPLVSAIAAGNCAIVKPSEIAPYTSKLLYQLIGRTFADDYVMAIEGDAETAKALLAEPFDHIFFTGSSTVGKLVMRAAAEHLTPVTLELGGKSPCVVSASANLEVAARRIIWGKTFNAGQTCVAPDYLLVHRSIKAPLMAAIAQTIQAFFGEDMVKSPDYGRIVSDRHFQRLQSIMEEALSSGKKIVGGRCDAETRYMELTVVDDMPMTATVMQEEIFGPILPVVSFDEISEAIAFINQRPKPLAIYLFSTNRKEQKVVQTQTSSGGLCFNETITQYAIPGLPFGGVGTSGMGKAHGKAGFETFSHRKTVMGKSNWLDLPLRYPPYKNKLGFLEKLL